MAEFPRRASQTLNRRIQSIRGDGRAQLLVHLQSGRGDASLHLDGFWPDEFVPDIPWDELLELVPVFDPVVPVFDPAPFAFIASNTDIPCGPIVITTGFPSFVFA